MFRIRMAWDLIPTPPFAKTYGYVHVGKDLISREANDDFLGMMATKAHMARGYVQGALNTKTCIMKNKT